MRREEQDSLAGLMAELSAAERKIAPPAGLESILLAKFDEAKSARRFRKTAAAFGAIAAALVLVALLHLRTSRVIVPHKATESPGRVLPAIVKKEVKAEPEPVTRRVRASRRIEPAEDTNPFVAIPWTSPPDPREPLTVMRVEMPVTALTAVGFTMPMTDPAASAQADVIVSEDGRIRAVRLVSFESSDFSSDRRRNP